MKDLELRDLIELATSDVLDGEDRIEKIFDWHFDRIKTTAQWMLGAAASLFIAVVVGFSRDELTIPWWQSGLLAVLAFATGAVGAYRLSSLGSVNRQYLAALRLYRSFYQVRKAVAKLEEA